MTDGQHDNDGDGNDTVETGGGEYERSRNGAEGSGQVGNVPRPRVNENDGEERAGPLTSDDIHSMKTKICPECGSQKIHDDPGIKTVTCGNCESVLWKKKSSQLIEIMRKEDVAAAYRAAKQKKYPVSRCANCGWVGNWGNDWCRECGSEKVQREYVVCEDDLDEAFAAVTDTGED